MAHLYGGLKTVRICRLNWCDWTSARVGVQTPFQTCFTQHHYMESTAMNTIAWIDFLFLQKDFSIDDNNDSNNYDDYHIDED